VRLAVAATLPLLTQPKRVGLVVGVARCPEQATALAHPPNTVYYAVLDGGCDACGDG
jgi:hypothetical protein